MKRKVDPRLEYVVLDTPVGDILVAGTNKAVQIVSFQSAHQQHTRHKTVPLDGWVYGGHLVERAAHELREYFDGNRRRFDVPLEPEGTEFQRRAWRALCEIPYGETRSYGEQARSMGAPSACRAVGAANGRNPIAIIIPCHRVVGADGRLTGFGGGLETKQYLLDLEHANIETLSSAGLVAVSG